MIAIVYSSYIYFFYYILLLLDFKVYPSILATSYSGPIEGVYSNPLLVYSSYSIRSPIELVRYSYYSRSYR
jgi:hypothetical protein